MSHYSAAVGVSACGRDTSAVHTHSPRRRLRREDERKASAGFPVWCPVWTGGAPAGAPAG